MDIIYRLTATFIFFFTALLPCQSGNLEKELSALTEDFKATVGVAVLKDNTTLALLNNNVQYPLMSVFKFHIAVAVLHKMAGEKKTLSDSLLVAPEDIKENTYSPLRETIPHKIPFKISFSTLLHYSIALSDNNACDILVRYCGGPGKVQKLLEGIGLTGFQLTETEDAMHENLMNCYNNWSTPLSTALLLKTIYEGDLLKGDYKKFLFDTMLATTTGTDKIKAGLPPDTPCAHKTGSSDRLPSGVMIGDNDAAIIFPRGKHPYYLVVFIKDSRCSSKENCRLIAQIARIVYTHVIGQR